jgi:hypothetical protein
MDDWMGPLDTCLYSVVVIACTQVLGMGGLAWTQPYGLLGLSRRISFLLLVEKMRPFVRMWLDDAGLSANGWDAWVLVQSVLSNGLILMATALVPPELADSEEGGVILTAVQYMYADVLRCGLVLWPDMRLALLALASAGLFVLGSGDDKGSRVWGTLRDVGSVACANLVVGIVARDEENGDALAGPWPRLMYLLLVTTMVHSAAAFTGVARTAQEYLVFLVAMGIATACADGLPKGADVAVVGFAAWLLYCVWPGRNAWISQCALVAFVNVLVSSALGYIRRLAAHDTFVTLKTSALVLQFLVHEVGVWSAAYWR